MPDEEAIVDEASTAATDVLFSRIAPAEIADLDLTIRLTEGELDIEIYVDLKPEAEVSEDTLHKAVDDATLAARSTVDQAYASSN